MAMTCECGFSVNTTSTNHYGLFTNIVETDFLHATNVTYSGVGSTGWMPQVYNVTAEQSRGEYGRLNNLSTIVTSPLSAGEWSGQPANGPGDPGLQLWVRSEVEDGLVPTAELALQDDDILYGSFRVAMKVPRINGTCSAFFLYHNDTQEIDIEYLSKNASIVHQIIQTADAAAKGFDASSTPDSKEWSSVFELAQDYHEYRFDWLPDRVEYYLDGLLTFTLTEEVPNSPGHLMLSHWSNGNAGWSMGPPEEDAVLTVSYVKAYYNTTRSSAKKCNSVTAPGAVCSIPSQLEPPDGYTPFFTISNDAPPSQSSSPSSLPSSGVTNTGTPSPGQANWWVRSVVALGVLGPLIARVLS